ncbi:anaerobic ribonucleoside-triphosphate reductase, partial [Klebsiella pneumoniae]
AAKFGDIPGVTTKGYYTNSFHLDVFRKVSPNCKIDFEAGYAQFASGGHISYCELPDMKRALKALEWVWDYTADKVPYFGTNTPVDYCAECGFMGETVATENGFACPCCGCHDSDKLQVTRRVCGYLGAPNSRPFIEGKQKEVIGRVKHTGSD